MGKSKIPSNGQIMICSDLLISLQSTINDWMTRTASQSIDIKKLLVETSRLSLQLEQLNERIERLEEKLQ